MPATWLPHVRRQHTIAPIRFWSKGVMRYHDFATNNVPLVAHFRFRHAAHTNTAEQENTLQNCQLKIT